MVFVLLLSLCVFASIHWMFSADYRSFGWLLLPFRVFFSLQFITAITLYIALLIEYFAIAFSTVLMHTHAPAHIHTARFFLYVRLESIESLRFLPCILFQLKCCSLFESCVRVVCVCVFFSVVCSWLSLVSIRRLNIILNISHVLTEFVLFLFLSVFFTSIKFVSKPHIKNDMTFVVF